MNASFFYTVNMSCIITCNNMPVIVQCNGQDIVFFQPGSPVNEPAPIDRNKVYAVV